MLNVKLLNFWMRFPWDQEQGKEVPNTALKVRVNGIRKDKEITMHTVWKGRSKMILAHSQHNCLQREEKETAKELLKPIREFNKVAGYKVNTPKPNLLLYLRNAQFYAKKKKKKWTSYKPDMQKWTQSGSKV